MSASVRNLLLLLAATAVAGSITALPINEEPQLVSGSGPLAGEFGGEALDGSGGGGAGGVGGSSGSAGSEGSYVGGSSGSLGGAIGGPGSIGGPGTVGGPGGGDNGSGGGDPNAKCAPGQNGGKTAPGVSSDSIKLAATHVTSGPGSTFLGQSQYGIQAIVAKVNAAGGICGRRLVIKLDNDGWDANTGAGYIRNYINSDTFALPVVPSSEGLRAAGPQIEDAGVPVIGSDGMLIDQYENDWIWPVATATVSQMRVMAKYAHDRDAEKFAIIYDSRYRFGVEGKDAYASYVNKIGGTLVHAGGIEPNQPGYGNQIRDLNSACDGAGGCDAVVMLVDPGTAEVWIAGDDRYVSRAKFRMGASPLFNQRFGQNCKARCDGMIVFTGYVPALEANQSIPGIRQYIQDVRAINPGADTANQFLQGAYLGMSVFVEALKKVGPNLTRDAMKKAMDSMVYKSDLSSTLSWTAEKRHANTKAQAWVIKASNSFDGFSDLRTGWLEDPDL